jgi:site-specific recombinase XerD
VQNQCKNRFNFTDLALRALPFSERTTYVWDGYTTLGLRIGKRSKTFIVIKPNGKRVTLGRYPALSLQSARRRINVPQPISASPLLSQALDAFLTAHAAKTRDLTQRNTRRLLFKHLEPVHGRTPLDQITTNDLTAIIDKLLRTPAEANNTHAKITAFFNWCVRRQIIPRNPLAGVPMPAKITSRDRVLTDPELAAVLKTSLDLAQTPYGMLILIIIHIPFRKNEAFTLTWSQITDHTITIPSSIAKNHVQLVVPNTIARFLSTIPKTRERLFPDNIHWQRAHQLFQQQARVYDWGCHDLRRSFSTKAVEWECDGADVATVEAILNHTTGSRSKIQRVYDKASRLPRMQRCLLDYQRKLHALIASH